jgi:nitroreductase
MVSSVEFEQVVRRRRMVRDYTDEPVDPAVVRRALDHATRAPNAGHTQGWGFVLLDTPHDTRRFWAAAGPDGVADPDRWLAGMMRAPVVVVPCSSKAAYLARYAERDKGRTAAQEGIEGSPWTVPYWHMDAAMAALLILQTAVDAGLGACFAGLPPAGEPAVRRELALPADVDPIGVVTMGHPAPGAGSGSTRRSRRPLDEVVHRGRWSHRPTPPHDG